MAPEERPRPQFTPPPWEAEAFERFRQEQERDQAARELENALIQVKRSPARHGVATSPEDEGAGSLPDKQVDAMLAELRAQEHTPPGVNLAFMNTAIAILGSIGVFVVVEALVLFSTTRGVDRSAVLLAAMASLIMLAIGAGCIAGAVVLYRKHHQ
jgi:hypothetical protein